MNTKVLSRTYLFEGLSVKELELLLVAAGEKVCAKNDVVFREGEAGNQVYMVSQGTVEIWKKESADLKGTCIGKVKDGELFGEMAVFDKQPRSASAIAAGEDKTKVLVWGEKDLMKLIQEYPALGTKIMTNVIKKLSGHLRNANNAIHSLRRTFLPVSG
ncbi:MAG: cyclic nucleotide-binding domain-containing protein [Deltaproteobacteria bacterium]|nr:cyclic nucleotide-binding domain-containing protein [Deltaproteobacteria bacterium]